MIPPHSSTVGQQGHSGLQSTMIFVHRLEVRNQADSKSDLMSYLFLGNAVYSVRSAYNKRLL